MEVVVIDDHDLIADDRHTFEFCKWIIEVQQVKYDLSRRELDICLLHFLNSHLFWRLSLMSLAKDVRGLTEIDLYNDLMPNLIVPFVNEQDVFLERDEIRDEDAVLIHARYNRCNVCEFTDWLERFQIQT